jgi:signal peptidase I
VRALVSWLVFALVCAAVWFTVGPTQLGGPANYVIVDGPSMEPTYQEGDLVVARAKASYLVGEVVAYLPDIGQRFPVIHRIVGMEGEGQYITQGDNRAQPDGWLATDANIFGAAWLHIPYGGRVIVFLRQPAIWLAAAVGLVGLGLIAGARQGRASTPWRKRGRHAKLKEREEELVDPRRTSWRKRGRHVKRYSLLPPILILFAFTASAANVAVDGGVLQGFQIEAELDVPVGAGLAAPVEPEPGEPVASAGENRSVAVGAAITLDGTGSTDPDGDSMAYAWTLTVPAGSTATLDDATSATPGFIADVAGTYTAELTVDDGRFISPPDTVVVTAIQSEPAITLTGLELRTYSTGTLTITLGEPAGAGGQEVTLASDPATLASQPSVATILEGETQADVTLSSGSAAGVVSIIATSPGFTDSTALIIVTARTMILQIDEVADLGASANGILVLGEPAPVGGTITLRSSDPAIVAVQPALATIDQGQTTVSFLVTGETEGTVVVTASGPGYRDATVEVAIAPAP